MNICIKIKRFIALGLLFAALLFGGCAAEPVQVMPPFWEVCDAESGGQVYMLGSMHAGVRGTVYPDYILEAFEDSDTVACEVDTVALSNDTAALTAAMSLMMCPSGTEAKDYFGSSYEQIRDFCVSKGIYKTSCDSYLPTLWSSLILGKMTSDCGYDSDYGTEAIFLEMAKKQNKVIYEIESAEFQYALSAGAPIALQVYNVESSVMGDYEEQLNELRELYRAWSSFDSDALEEMSVSADVPEELYDDYEAYYYAMYTARQKVMADYVISCLENGDSVFMLVGAMHYYAEPDIITLLQQAGYEVAEITEDTYV